MFDILQLQQQMAHKAAIGQDLVDRADKSDPPRPMTTDEVHLFDQVQREITTLEDQIAGVKAHLERKQKQDDLTRRLQETPGRVTQADQPARTEVTAAVSKPFLIPATARRTGTLKAFKGVDAEYKAYKSGMWIFANIFRNHRAAHWCANNGVGIQNTMGSNSNTDGGYLVPDEMANAIIDLREEYGVFRRECRVWPMSSDTLMIPRRLAGVTIGQVGENPASAISQSSPTFNQVQLVAKKCGGLTLMSSEITEDAAMSVADWVSQEFGYGFALFEDQCGFIGDGTSTYLGIRGLTNLMTETLALVGAVLATATHNTFATVTQTDLSSVMGALPQYAAANAKFYCSRVCAELVFGRLMASAGGNSVDTLQGGRGQSYLGYPIVISQVLPTTTGTITDGTPILFFGDLRKSSSLGDRRMVSIFASEHRYMDTDQIAIRGLERIDIVNHDLGTTVAGGAGPIVALLANAS